MERLCFWCYAPKICILLVNVKLQRPQNNKLIRKNKLHSQKATKNKKQENINKLYQKFPVIKKDIEEDKECKKSSKINTEFLNVQKSC